MTREELLRSDQYWMLKIQVGLFQEIENYMLEKNINRSQLADQLNVTKGYITQVLNGDFDHRISRLVHLALQVGKVPVIEFKSLNKIIYEDQQSKQLVSYSQLLTSPLDDQNEYLEYAFEGDQSKVYNSTSSFF